MAALTELISHFYTMTLIFFTLLLLELAVLLRSIPETLSLSASSKARLRPTTPAKFIDLIEAKNPTIQFSIRSSSRKKGFPTDCAVCLSEFKEGEDLRRLICKHAFHKACLDTWLLQRLATCPLCRSKVLPDDVVAEYHQVQSLTTDLEYDGSDEEMVFFLSAVQDHSLHRFLN